MSLLKRLGNNQPQQNSPAGPTDEKADKARAVDSLRGRTVNVPTQAKDNISDIKGRVQTKLLNELPPNADTQSAEIRTTIRELFETILTEEAIRSSRKFWASAR